MEFIQEELNEIKNLLCKIRSQQSEFLTIEEASEYLKVSKSCIYKLTSNKEIPYYVPGGKKIYFRKEELDNWILESRVDSSYQEESKVNSFLCRTKNS